MSDNIKVDSKLLKTYSAEILNRYKNMCSYLAESKTTVKNLKSTWTGEGAAEFYAKFDTIIAMCEETLVSVNAYAITLSEASDVYGSNEKKISDSTSKLKINLK